MDRNLSIDFKNTPVVVWGTDGGKVHVCGKSRQGILLFHVTFGMSQNCSRIKIFYFSNNNKGNIPKEGNRGE